MARTAEECGKDDTKAADVTGKPAGGASGGITAPTSPAFGPTETAGNGNPPRSWISKMVRNYMKHYDLQHTKGRRQINGGDELQDVFGKTSVSMSS